MARPVRSLALVVTLVTLFPAAALAEEARDEGEKEAAPASSASSDGSSATAPTAPSPSGENEAPTAPRKAPARAALRAPEPPREQPLLPNVATAEEYKGIIETVEESVKDRTADLSDVHRLAAMKADYAKRTHMRNPILAGTGVFFLVTGVSASLLGSGFALAGAAVSGKESSSMSGINVGGAVVLIGLIGLAGGVGIAVGGGLLYSYGAAAELDPPKQPRPNRVTLHLSPFGAAGTF